MDEDTEMSAASVLHSRYMVKTGHVGHEEDPASPWYTPEGDLAARRGNVYASGSPSANYRSAINAWMTGPFHLVGIIDPLLNSSGYGDYREVGAPLTFAATLDVLTHRTVDRATITWPIFYPSDEMPHLAYAGRETPDPLTGCPGYSTPSGPPLALLLGPGDVVPQVTRAELTGPSGRLDACVFDQTSYTNPNAALQSLGRGILRGRGAIIVMPRSALDTASAYTVTIVNSGETHSWEFVTRPAHSVR